MGLNDILSIRIGATADTANISQDVKIQYTQTNTNSHKLILYVLIYVF